MIRSEIDLKSLTSFQGIKLNRIYVDHIGTKFKFVLKSQNERHQRITLYMDFKVHTFWLTSHSMDMLDMHNYFKEKKLILTKTGTNETTR